MSCEIKTPYVGAVGILLSRCGKFITSKFKSGRKLNIEVNVKR